MVILGGGAVSHERGTPVGNPAQLVLVHSDLPSLVFVICLKGRVGSTGSENMLRLVWMQEAKPSTLNLNPQAETPNSFPGGESAREGLV